MATSRASEELVWRAQHASTAYEAGDFVHAEGTLHDILAHADELRTSLSEVERVSWKAWAQCRLGELLWARPSTSAEQRLEYARDAWDLSSAVVDMANKASSQYREAFLDGLYIWGLSAWSLGQIDELRRIAQFFESAGMGQCRCGSFIRLNLLKGILALEAERVPQAEAFFLEVRRYTDASRHYGVVARLALAECALRDYNALGAARAQDALEQLASVNRAYAKGIGIGAILGWLPHFPLAAREAEKHYRWQAQSAPVMSLGRTRTQEPKRTGQTGLRIHAFGKGEVIYKGTRVDFGGARTALTFLVYLAMHPEGQDADRLVIDLWPGKTTAPIDKALAACRALLGDDKALSSRGGIFRLTGDVWFDCAQYEGKYERAMGAAVDDATLFESLRQVRDLYRAPFLLGLDNLWANQVRRHYQEAQAWLLWEMARCCGEASDVRRSIALLEECLEIDPVFDRAMVDLVRQMDQLGLRSPAAVRLRNYRDRIRKLLEMEPSHELRDIFERWQNAPDQQLTAAFSTADLPQALRRPTSLPSQGQEDEMPRLEAPAVATQRTTNTLANGMPQQPNGSAFLR